MIWHKGDEMRALNRSESRCWQVASENGEILLRGSRPALESWLRRCGFVPL